MKLSLKEIDLSKSDKHNHPDINEENNYIALIGKYLYFGTFTKEWYGFNFNCNWGNSGIQFDAPGYNNSEWKQLWKVKKK